MELMLIIFWEELMLINGVLWYCGMKLHMIIRMHVWNQVELVDNVEYFEVIAEITVK